MKDHLDQRIQAASERLHEKRKLDAMLAESADLLKRMRDEFDQQTNLLANERADVERLEGLSVTGLFYTILGTKEERLDKERQEYLVAKLKHDATAKAVAEITQEIKKIELDLGARQNAEAEYQRLIKEKHELLVNTQDKCLQPLLELSEQLGQLSAQIKELSEAVSAGQTAYRTLERVATELRSASEWGMWDVFGGGMISSSIKFAKIDNAKSIAHVAQRQLQRFRVELADVGNRLQLALDIGEFARFVDIYFGGMIIDWQTQSRIQHASDACTSTMRKVRIALQDCHRKSAELQERIAEVNRRRAELIETA